MPGVFSGFVSGFGEGYAPTAMQRLRDEEEKRQAAIKENEALNSISNIGKLIKAKQDNPKAIQMYLDAKSRMESLPPEKLAQLPEHARTLPTQMEGVGDMEKVANIGGEMEGLRYKFPDNKTVQAMGDRWDTATRFNDPDALKGIQQYADNNKDKHPVTSNFMNLTSNLGMGDIAFANANKLSQSQANESGGYGKSSVGAALEFTKSEEGQAMVKRSMETLDMMRNSGKNYDPIALKAAEDNLHSDVRYAQQLITKELFKPQTARLIGEETQDVTVETAGKKAKATKDGTTSALDRMSDSMRGALEGLYGGIAELEIAQKQFDEDFVGPLQGRAGTIAQKIGTIGEAPAVFRETIQRFMNELIKARSGAAVSDQEFERIKTETFDFSLNENAYKAKMKSNMDFLKRKIDRLLDSQKNANIDTAGYKRFNTKGNGASESEDKDPLGLFN